ncbi:hypothetical protein J1N35_015075 [Gossypium stocksii]|uniref:Uncharacterized protein n=1 Tax=Gossypium stocksii TaxID=47602 RepID=A0A9D3VXL5_9ROSI|nr:hypothetical protein J1N35_015075 [Gossypium stocksii]
MTELLIEDSELVDVAVVSAGNNNEIGKMIDEAMSTVGRKGVITLEKGNRIRATRPCRMPCAKSCVHSMLGHTVVS